MQSFEDGEKNGNKSENGTLENGKIPKKISWDGLGEKEGGVIREPGHEEKKNQVQVHFIILLLR